MDRTHFQNKEHKAYDIFMEKQTRFQPCYEYVFLGLRNNRTNRQLHTVAGSERFVRRLKFLNCIFLKGKILYNPKYFVRFGQILVS